MDGLITKVFKAYKQIKGGHYHAWESFQTNVFHWIQVRNAYNQEQTTKLVTRFAK